MKNMPWINTIREEKQKQLEKKNTRRFDEGQNRTTLI